MGPTSTKSDAADPDPAARRPRRARRLTHDPPPHRVVVARGAALTTGIAHDINDDGWIVGVAPALAAGGDQFLSSDPAAADLVEAAYDPESQLATFVNLLEIIE